MTLTPGLPATARRRIVPDEETWGARLRAALDADGLVLYTQPIVDLRDGHVARHEVLVRLATGAGEDIAAAEFIPAAERLGLIGRIDAWVAEAAIDLIAAHARAGRRLRLEVNLSGASLNDGGLADRIEARVRSSAIDPGCLCFEVTETAAVADLTQACAFARRITALGCELSLDDFGAGFGGFLYLKHMDFATLKIDGSLIGELPTSARDQVLVRSIVRLAQELGCATVAERVTDGRTCRVLRAIGVRYAQGFGLGHPRPAAELWPGPPVGGHPFGMPAAA